FKFSPKLMNPYMKEKFALVIETIHINDTGKQENNPGYMKENFIIIIESLHLADTGMEENNPGYMKENFIISIESLHLADTGMEENVHELLPEKLKHRDVVHIDIANDPVTSADYKADEDPTKFKSEKTGRGPLVGQWMDKVNPVMTCYKLVTVEFKWFGLQSKIESFIQKSERRLFTNFHRQVFCWMDRWYGLTMEDIRAIEDKTKEELDKQRNLGEVRGMKAETE
ncbi:hypothetical protein L9F63_017811, partial [Diploptera punctata]